MGTATKKVVVDRVLEWNEADLIRKLRAETGITLERLAAESRLSITTINRIELGKTAEAKRATLAKLAAVFGLTYEDFMAAIPRRHQGVRVRVHEAKVAQWREERKRTKRRPRTGAR